MNRIFLCSMATLFAYGSCIGDGQTADESGQTRVSLNGDSVLIKNVGGKAIRVAVSTYKVDIGAAGQTPHGVRKTNCTNPTRPCSQVSNLSIWVDRQKLFVPRSVFADCTDVGTMSLTSAAGLNVLTFVGGDGADGYTVKLFFDLHRVKRREVYADEANSLVEATTYLPPAVLK